MPFLYMKIYSRRPTCLVIYVVYVFLIGNNDFNNVAAFIIVQTEEE